MISHLLTTKNTKESKKHCRKSHFTKERPVLSKITKNIVAAFHFWRKSKREYNAFLFAVFVRTSTFFGFFISLAKFRVFCLFRCWFLLLGIQQQNISFLNERAENDGKGYGWNRIEIKNIRSTKGSIRYGVSTKSSFTGTTFAGQWVSAADFNLK